jgi:hypothetical protein
MCQAAQQPALFFLHFVSLGVFFWAADNELRLCSVCALRCGHTYIVNFLTHSCQLALKIYGHHFS